MNAAMLCKERDKWFDALEVAKPDEPIFRTIPAENYLEAKRTIRAYLREIMEVTQT